MTKLKDLTTNDAVLNGEGIEKKREFLGTVEKEGVEYQQYKVVVTKNNKEMIDTITVEVPASWEDLDALSDEEKEEVLTDIKRKIITDERNTHRRQGMISEEEKQKKLNKKLQELKALGLDEAKIKELL